MRGNAALKHKRTLTGPHRLSGVDNLSTFHTTIKSPARAYVSADEALVDQARARCPVGKDAFARRFAEALPRGKRHA